MEETIKLGGVFAEIEKPFVEFEEESTAAAPIAAHDSDMQPEKPRREWRDVMKMSQQDTKALRALFMTEPQTIPDHEPVERLKNLIRRAIDEKAGPVTMFQLMAKLYGLATGDSVFFREVWTTYPARFGDSDTFKALEDYGALYIRYFYNVPVADIEAAAKIAEERRAGQ